jgi:hypothetical protein
MPPIELHDLKSLISEIMFKFSEIYAGEYNLRDDAGIRRLREDVRMWWEALVNSAVSMTHFSLKWQVRTMCQELPKLDSTIHLSSQSKRPILLQKLGSRGFVRVDILEPNQSLDVLLVRYSTSLSDDEKLHKWIHCYEESHINNGAWQYFVKVENNTMALDTVHRRRWILVDESDNFVIAAVVNTAKGTIMVSRNKYVLPNLYAHSV